MAGVPRPRYSPEQRAQMVRLYRDELLSLNEVAARFGCDHSTVRRWLELAGVPRRTAAEQREAVRERFRTALTAPPPTAHDRNASELERLGVFMAAFRKAFPAEVDEAAAAELEQRIHPERSS